MIKKIILKKEDKYIFEHSDYFFYKKTVKYFNELINNKSKKNVEILILQEVLIRWRQTCTTKNKMFKELMDIEQLAGKALDYPWYKDDQKNFPDATEEHGVCVGDHVPYTIVEELANNYKKIKKK